MKTLKNILFYCCIMFALSGYICYEFSNSFLTSDVKLEILDSQTESETRDSEERTHSEEYSHSNSHELLSFSLFKKMQYYTQLHIIPFGYKSLVWTPPKHA